MEEFKRKCSELFHRKATHNRFAKELQGLSRTPFTYEDDALIEKAFNVIPLEQIYSGAEKRQVTAEQEGHEIIWDHQDYVIMELLEWFKKDFFQWVNSLKCPQCGNDTEITGATGPTSQERNDGAGNAELHHCRQCNITLRFPRYNHPKRLLDTHRGRCGEWANCFTLLCRALGTRTRWIWNSEDHVWTEVYSISQNRWVHCDACENAWDKPQLYEQGWGKRMAYCIGFSVEGATDVTRRYVRDKNKALPRNKISEMDLSFNLSLITSKLREPLSSSQKEELVKEDESEQLELESYQVDKTQKSEPRQTGSAEWTAQRGEDGSK